MSEYLCEVFLGNVNFTQNTPHRYLNISGHFNIKSAIMHKSFGIDSIYFKMIYWIT